MSTTNQKWKVYKLTSPTGRVYVGCTELQLEKRWEKGHNYKHNRELFNDIVQYGWNTFRKDVIFTSDDESQAREMEHELIKEFPNGYNIYRGIKGYIPTGNPPSPSKRVLCVETKQEYLSIHEASSSTGLSRVKISECCNGKRKRTGGYHWKFI